MMKWISVNDRLREPGIDVVVFGEGCCEVAFRGNDVREVYWVCDAFFGADCDAVTHWMPLPDAPEDRS